MRKVLLHSLAVLIATITFGLQESSAQTILSSINPASALQGQMVTVTFRGKNFTQNATTDAAGTLYFSEASGNLIRKLNADGTISTVVNTASNPHGLVFDSSGNLYFSDAGNGKVRKRTPGGAISDIATQLNTPTGLAIDAARNLYVAEFNGHRVLKIALDNNNAVTPVAGTGAPGTGAEGVLGTASALKNPYDVAVDKAGNI
jgi:sugar lactone lactonase YvrE